VFVGLAIALALQATLGWLQNLALTRVARKLSVHMTAESLWRTLRLPISFFVSKPAGETAYAVTLNDRMAWTIGGQLSTAAMSAVIAVIYGAFLLRYDLLLAAITLLLTVASIVVVRVASNRLRPLNRELVEALAAASGT